MGKTDLLRHFWLEREVAGEAVALVELDQLGTPSPHEVLAGLARGLAGPPIGLRPVRFQLVAAVWGAGTAQTAGITRGVPSVAAGAAGLGAAAAAVDATWAAIKGGTAAVRLARANTWLVENVAPDWRAKLANMTSRSLAGLMPAALAADIAEASRHDRAALCIDGLQPDAERPTDVESVVRALSEQLVALDANAVLVVAAHERVSWSGVLQEPLEEIAPSEAHRLLEDFGVPAADADAVIAAVGGFPLGLVLAAQWLAGGGAAGGLTALAAEARASGRDIDSVRRLVALGILREILTRTDADLAAFLRAVAVPRFFSPTLSYRLHDVDHDRLFKRITSRPYVRRIDVPELGEPAWGLHDLVRLGVRTQWEQGPQWRELHQRSLEWLDDVLARTDVKPFVMQSARIEHLVEVSSERALREGLALVKEQTGASAFDRATEVLDVLAVQDWESDVRAELLVATGRVSLVRGRHAEALELLNQAAALLSEHRSLTPLSISVLKNTAEAYRVSGDYRSALEVLLGLDRLVESERAISGESASLTISRAWADWGLSLTYKAMDRIGPASHYAAAVDRASAALDDPKAREAADLLGMQSLHEKRADMALHRAEICRCAGDYVGAERALDQASAGYSDLPGPRRAYALVTRAQLRRMEGLFDEAVALAQTAGDEFASLRDARGEVIAFGTVAEIMLAQGAVDEARQLLERLRGVGDRYPPGPLYGALGLAEVARREGSLVEALALYAEADRECRLMGGNIESACALLGRAECFRALDDEVAAAESADRGRDIAQRCGYLTVLVHAEVIFTLAAQGGDNPSPVAAERLLASFNHRPESRRREDRLVAQLRDEDPTRRLAPVFIDFP